MLNRQKIIKLILSKINNEYLVKKIDSDAIIVAKENGEFKFEISLRIQ